MNESAHWRLLYKAAILEVDPNEVKLKIKAAVEAMTRRIADLDRDPGSLKERHELADAIASLRYWDKFNSKRTTLTT
jgi:hypothetical protein